MKATCQAPANIAFIKYWGKKNEKLRIPLNSSISMNLSNVYTITTIEFSSSFKKDSFQFKNEFALVQEKQRVFKNLDRIRKIAGINLFAKIVSQNSFPKSIGMSSSASGLAALILASCQAAGLNFSEKKLSQIARVASGSSCRSIPDGFVEWQAGSNDKNSYAFSLFPADYWQIFDVVVIVNEKTKKIKSTSGHSLAATSPFLKTRLQGMAKKIKLIKKYLQKKDFTAFGELCEKEALNMHAIMISSWPSLLYWTSETLVLMKMAQQWRNQGLETYFTLNTGQTVHFLILKKDLKKLLVRLKKLKIIQRIIINQPANGAKIINKHLF